jgi:hypothetical protein
MVYSAWDVTKDFLGALGSIMMAVPWLRDFYLRYRREKLRDIPTGGGLTVLRDSIKASLRDKIDSPKIADFIWTMLGLLAIFFSFAIALIRGLAAG